MQQSFASTPSEWKKAKRPNYEVNKDLEYPYSECPFVGDYDLIRIPKAGTIEHVDYWGEGRIVVPEGISGFPDCYNVNHAYQLVSNGDENIINRKIPNRIAVVNYTDCETGGYIKDESVRIVTLMGAPINKSCARDIARMIVDELGLVVIYNINRTSADAKNLDETLNRKNIVCCPGFELPKKLQGLTLYDSHLAFVHITEFKETLYNNITSAQYDNAVKLCIELRNANQGKVVHEIIERLLDGNNQKTMTFAYKLWVGGAQDIVKDWFPSEFQHILGTDDIKIISNYYSQAMKLDANVNGDKDRVAWGDSSDKSSRRVTWKCIPQTDNNHVVFKIRNNEHSMFLKLDTNVDSDGDRKCYGSDGSGEKRHKWALEPLRYNGDMLFFIINYEYQQGLKLAVEKDLYGDRVVWGHNGNIIDKPNYFGWKIKPMS